VAQGDAGTTEKGLAMQKATLDQAAKILAILDDTPLEQVQAMLSSGLFADLRDGNLADVNRDEFRQVLGLRPLNVVAPVISLVQTRTQHHGGHESLRIMLNEATRQHGIQRGAYAFYHEHPDQIPADWKRDDVHVFFPDSSFSTEPRNRTYIQFVRWCDNDWIWSFLGVNDQVGPRDFVVVPA
jgi:hypothetical protein